MAKPHHYVISDLHLGHQAILKYCRPWFDDIDQHNNHIIEEISKLGAHDVCHILGDVAFTKEGLALLKKVKCQLRMVGGNHDRFKTALYLEVFHHVVAYDEVHVGNKKVIMSHIPVHPDQFNRWDYNLHGHLHAFHVGDPRYINCCCEALDFKPTRISELIEERI